jgi:hypothetical protein
LEGCKTQAFIISLGIHTVHRVMLNIAKDSFSENEKRPLKFVIFRDSFAIFQKKNN